MEVTNLDWRGQKCPAPIVNTSKALQRLGGRASMLRILSDDASFPADLKSWCRATKAELMRIDHEPNGVFTALVRVNGGQSQPLSTGTPTTGTPSTGIPIARPPRSGSQGTAVGSNEPESPNTLDCRGLQCPAPIVTVAKAARTLAAGSEIVVLADDTAFPMDIKSWCRGAGSSLLSFEEKDGHYCARIRIKTRTDAETTIEDTGPTALPSVNQPASSSRPAANRTATPSRGISNRPATNRPGIASRPATDRPGPASQNHLRVDLAGLAPGLCSAMLDSLDRTAVPELCVTLTATHRTFPQELTSWCARVGHTLERLNTDATPMVAEVRLKPAHQNADPAAETDLVPARAALPAALEKAQKECTLLVLHNDMEALLAALMTANAAAASGMSVRVYFAFWGLNVLRGERPRRDVAKRRVSLVQRMFKWMMPRGPKRQRLGKLSFGGIGGFIMRIIMKRRNMMVPEELIEQACSLGVRFVVCTMSMSVMGITERDLMALPNIEFAGVTAFVGDARGAGVSLVF